MRSILVSLSLSICALATAAEPWTTVATEGQSFTVSGTQTVRYGLGARWTQKQVTGTVKCSNSVFGDPYPYRVKQCEVQATQAPGPANLSAAPKVFFTDLDSGPNTGGLNNKGAIVTVYGKNFGATRGSSFVTVGGGAVDNYISWSDTKVVVQLGSSAKTGDIALVNGSGLTSNGVPFTVRSGPIYFVSASGNGDGSFASPMSPNSFYAAVKPGATFYVRGGNYPGMYGHKTYNDFNIVFGSSKGGTPGNPVAVVGYPGETATFSGQTGVLSFRDADSPAPAAKYITVANLRMVCNEACVHSSANTGQGVTKSGAANIRLVGNVMSASYTWNTATGIIAIGGDGWRVLGNELKDTGAYEPGTTEPIKNNHAIYVQVGASDIDIGWNYLHHLRMGHLIQVHTDIASKHENVRIHDNVITASAVGEARGINIGDTLPGTYGEISGNVISNLGADFSGIAIYSGDWKITRNTLHNINAYSGMLWLTNQSGKPTATITDNIFVSDGKSPYIGLWDGTTGAQAKVSGNVYFGKGAGPAFDASAINANPKLGADFKPTSPAAIGKGAQ